MQQLSPWTFATWTVTAVLVAGLNCAAFSWVLLSDRAIMRARYRETLPAVVILQPCTENSGSAKPAATPKPSKARADRPTKAEIQAHARAEADREGVPRRYVFAVIQKESTWRPDARGAHGEIGLGQFKPGTARAVGIDPYDWRDNVRGVAIHLRNLHSKFGNWPDAFAGYNRGAGDYENPLGRAYAASVMASAETQDRSDRSGQ